MAGTRWVGRCVAAVTAVTAVMAICAASARAASAWRWPVDGTPTVVRTFEPPPTPYAAGHRGVDLAAVPGATVRAAGAGVVAFAGMVAGRPVVSVDHPGGLRTTYEPVVPAVRAGQVLAAGAPLGALVAGHPDCAAVACLHWGLRRGRVYLDPLALLGLGRVRLLPLRDGDAAPVDDLSRAGPRAAAAPGPVRDTRYTDGPAVAVTGAPARGGRPGHASGVDQAGRPQHRLAGDRSPRHPAVSQGRQRGATRGGRRPDAPR